MENKQLHKIKLYYFLLISFFLITGSLKSQEFELFWNQKEGVVFNTETRVLMKTEKTGWGNSGAISHNVLLSSQDGYVRRIITDIKTTNSFGLAIYNKDHLLKSIDYSFFQSGYKIMIVEKGKILGNYGQLHEGDVLEIIRKGPHIHYLKNGKELRECKTDADMRLYVDVVMYEDQSTFGNIKASFGLEKMEVSYQKSDLDCFSNEAGGSIELIMKGGSPPFDINWKTRESSSGLYGLLKGNYSAEIFDSKGESAKVTVDINYLVDWILPPNISMIGKGLYKAGYEGWNKEGNVYSNNKLSSKSDGFIELIVEDFETIKFFGLSHSKNSSYRSTDHCFYIKKGFLYIFDNGKLLGRYGKVQQGTSLSIKKKSGNIHYYKNGNLLTKRKGLGRDYYIIGNIYTQHSILEPISASFCSGCDLPVKWEIHDVSRDSTGWIKLQVPKGSYSFFWSDSIHSNPTYNLNAGLYSVSVTDFQEKCYQGTRYVLSSIYWTKLTNIIDSKGDLFKKSNRSSWDSGASSRNILKKNQDGMIRYTSDEDYSEKALGFNVLDKGTSYSELTYSIFFRKKRAYIYELGKRVKDLGVYSRGDIFEIKKEKGFIKYVKNRKLVYQSHFIETDLIVDVALFSPKSYFKNIQASFTNYPYIIISTESLDPKYSYKLEGNGLKHSGSFGSSDLIWLNRINNHYYTYLMTIGDGDLFIKFDVTKEYKITNVKFKSENKKYIPLDKNLYKIHKNNLVFYDESIVQKPLSGYSPIFPDLESGLLMSPNKDGHFDVLKIEGVDNVTDYQISISDISGNKVFLSRDKTRNWNGIDINTKKRVKPGTYNYVIKADGLLFKGQFLVEY